jgi:uncharacterized protein
MFDSFSKNEMIRRPDSIKLLRKYYKADSKAFWFLTEHGKSVARKALLVARNVSSENPDLGLLEDAAMLHDIGIFLTNAPDIGCCGESPYICHGILGREILEKEGLPDHALICERHVGVGLTCHDIVRENLPLPQREMIPITIEEQIICFADKFFSKNRQFLTREKKVMQIRNELSVFGKDKIEVFDRWYKMFS